jgi:hypothetical protein
MVSRQMSLFDAGSAVDQVRSWAFMDPEQKYRYRLWRVWDPERPRIVFVMLNPSTADALQDDATIRTCRRLAERWEYGALDVVNLFAWRCTDPADLVAAARRGVHVVGPDNDQHLDRALGTAGGVVAAWGAHRAAGSRAVDVLRRLHEHGPVHCLGLTRGGAPRHPLYARNDTQLVLMPATIATIAGGGSP